MSGVRVVRPDQLKWNSLEVEGSERDVLSEALSDPASPEIKGTPGIGAGFVDFEKLEMDYTVTFDETCYVIEGAIHLTSNGETEIVRAGEVFNIKYGTTVRVEVPDHCRVFYAAYPANWSTEREGELEKLVGDGA